MALRMSDNGPSSDPLTAAIETPICLDCGFDICTCDQERHYGFCICMDCACE